MKYPYSFAAALTALLFTGSTAMAQDCPVSTGEAFDLEEAEIVSIYECMKDQMAAGYAKAGDEIGSNFRSWAVTGTRMGVPGPHGERLLLTFANDTAVKEYLKFAE